MSRYAASCSKFHEAFSITARPHMKQDTVPSLINAYEVWLQKINIITDPFYIFLLTKYYLHG